MFEEGFESILGAGRSKSAGRWFQGRNAHRIRNTNGKTAIFLAMRSVLFNHGFILLHAFGLCLVEFFDYLSHAGIDLLITLYLL